MCGLAEGWHASPWVGSQLRKPGPPAWVQKTQRYQEEGMGVGTRHTGPPKFSQGSYSYKPSPRWSQWDLKM